MNKALVTRLNKLECAKEAGKLSIISARFRWELAEAEAAAARLEAEGRRVLLIRWQWEEDAASSNSKETEGKTLPIMPWGYSNFSGAAGI